MSTKKKSHANRRALESAVVAALSGASTPATLRTMDYNSSALKFRPPSKHRKFLSTLRLLTVKRQSWLPFHVRPLQFYLSRSRTFPPSHGGVRLARLSNVPSSDAKILTSPAVMSSAVTIEPSMVVRSRSNSCVMHRDASTSNCYGHSQDQTSSRLILRTHITVRQPSRDVM